jgi:hypothetical protein
LGGYRQAVLVIRWFLDGTRLAQPAVDHGIGTSTANRYLHEGIDALATAAPDLPEPAILSITPDEIALRPIGTVTGGRDEWVEDDWYGVNRCYASTGAMVGWR